MQVKFYNFLKRTNSTKQPTDSDLTATVNALLKQPSPKYSLSLECSNVPLNVNYCYIEALNRYYYVDDFEPLTADITRFNLKMDVLASFKNSILTTECYVLRASREYNTALIDNYFPTESGTTQIVRNADFIPLANPGFIVSVIGANADAISNTSGVAQYYLLTDTALANLIKFIFNQENYADEITDQVVKTFFNPSQYLVSCMYCPFVSGTTGETIQLGWWDTGISAMKLNPMTPIEIDDVTISIPRPNANANRFLNYEPYASYRIYIPFIGLQNISSDLLKGCSSIIISGVVDVCTGELMLKVRGDNGRIIANFEAKGCVDLPLAQSSMPLNQITATAGVANIISDATGLSQSTFGGAVSDIATGILSVARQISSNGTAGNSAQRIFDSQVHLICDYSTLAGTDYSKFGAPLCETRTLSTLSGGYVQCLKPRFQNSIATYAEISEVENHLEGGVYLE